MAKKLKLMSLFQELSGRALVTNRRPVQPATGVYLMQLRAQSGAATLPRRRFMIEVDLHTAQSLPAPVKINHVRMASTPSAPAPSSPPRVSAIVQKSGVPQVRPGVD